MWYVIKKDELYHHGILGQKWGKRNGPPYPLDASDHSASEKKAKWRKSLDSDGEGSYNKNQKEKRKGLSDKQKKAIKIGVAVTATALVAVGGYALYRSGKLNELAAAGKTKVGALFGDASDLGKDATSGLFDSAAESASGSLKRLVQKESLADTITKVNPHRGNPIYENNCSYCGIAAILRQRGFDVTAKDSGGKMQNLLGVVENCFKNAKTLEGSAAKFGKSPDDAAEMLVKRFGQNASGVCGVTWKGGTGHVFNWAIKNGDVSFFDSQTGTSNVARYWSIIDQVGNLQLARLDDAEIIDDAIKGIVE